MSITPRGSEWRKWDLHMHAPGTKLSDQYRGSDSSTLIDEFCRIVNESDVAVLGITDYFSFDAFFAVQEKYLAMYGDDHKLLLPNLELRLPVSLNKEGQAVNLHIIFNPEIFTREVANKFLSNLQTAGTKGRDRTRVNCDDLKSSADYQSATVSLDAIDDAIRATFGDFAIAPLSRQEHLVVIASAKGDGIRPGGSGIKRKNLLTDEIDKYCDAFYSNAGSKNYFLDKNRLETSEKVAAKPVFDGCDAHSFEDLRANLGKANTSEGQRRSITWVKADPTYSGLLQTLIEPAERVILHAVRPDQKEPYRVISRVTFSGTADFPGEIVFNQNLSSIIGSRSSGKSALLAHIAYAVDPEGTVATQTEAQKIKDSKDAGPAAGFTWNDVADMTCQVEWASGGTTAGKTIYIPQNSLYRLSEQPEEITKKISPALFRAYPDLRISHENAVNKIVLANSTVKNQVGTWFSLAERIDAAKQEATDLGDKVAIVAERDRLQLEINEIKSRAHLSDKEVSTYQQIAQNLGENSKRLDEINDEIGRLSPYVIHDIENAKTVNVADAVQVSVAVRPNDSEVPTKVSARIAKIKSDSSRQIIQLVEEELRAALIGLVNEREEIKKSSQSIKESDKDLIQKHDANDELSEIVEKHKKQVARLGEIETSEKSQLKLSHDQDVCIETLKQALVDRKVALSGLLETFSAEPRTLEGLSFGVEAEVLDEIVKHVSAGFSQRKVSEFIENRGAVVSYEKAQLDPALFLSALRSGAVALNKNYVPEVVAADVLTITEEIRFSAELDSDRIGGFAKSSMTPGKQALFALTLILNESQEPWPLLIDQPEDDLDSRSIYEVIVPYIMNRKKERQIIMVSHNANLVIGADSEQVIVANRHGDDRRNTDNRMFEYYSGALEHTQTVNKLSQTALGRYGVREHACEILDGGEEAFEKRRNKYKILA
ncbi:TrlF family AAA-like ATPase [Glutamicibacter sp. AOP5-A2-18]|uniref:TrlF family AAA-like ATPase n=1 Tax=Glutamicibacter sp. AOP5-A2-18 TaxID=3457656 RepID=UPI004033E251